LNEIEQICDRVLFLKEGRLVRDFTISKKKNHMWVQLWISTTDDQKALELLQGLPYIFAAASSLGGIACSVAGDQVGQITRFFAQSAIDVLRISAPPPALENLYLSEYQEASHDVLG
jgi:ABC-type multidrug transport system ATPase subunit